MSAAMELLKRMVGSAKVDVYREGEAVVFVGRADATLGQATITSRNVASWPSVEAYEADRDKGLNRALASPRFVLIYPKAKQLALRLGFDLDADVRNAPPLPADLRHLLAPALPSIAPRPFGFLGRGHNAR